MDLKTFHCHLKLASSIGLLEGWKVCGSHLAVKSFHATMTQINNLNMKCKKRSVTGLHQFK